MDDLDLKTLSRGFGNEVSHEPLSIQESDPLEWLDAREPSPSTAIIDRSSLSERSLDFSDLSDVEASLINYSFAQTPPLYSRNSSTPIDMLPKGDISTMNNGPGTSDDIAVEPIDVKEARTDEFESNAGQRKAESLKRAHIEEFETETERCRKDSRITLDASNDAPEAQKVDNTPKSIERSDNAEGCPAEMPEKHDATLQQQSPASSDVPSAPQAKQMSLAEQIVDAVSKSERKYLRKGDMAVVLDPDDLNKSILISSRRLLDDTDIPNINISIGRKESESEVRVVLVLIADKSMPHLSQLMGGEQGDYWKDFERQRSMLYIQESGSTSMNEEDSVKHEDGADAAKDSEPRIDWIRAYESFFDVVGSKTAVSKRRFFASDAELALPHLQAVVAIAKHYRSTSAIDAAFKDRILDCIDNGSLYHAIAKEAASWLSIGISMRNVNVFKEAFVHVAGRYPEWPWSKPILRLPTDVLESVEQKSKMLRFRRYDVDQRLLTLTLKTNVKVSPGTHEFGFVSIRHDPVAWMAGQCFSNWLSEHIAIINGLVDNDIRVTPSANATVTCSHPDGICLNLGGFYRLLSKGGDAYLALEGLMKLLGDWDKTFKENKAEIREKLLAMKAEAAKMVAGLTKSTLHYVDEHKLQYLTCITVDDSDMPWRKERGEDDMELDEEEEE